MRVSYRTAPTLNPSGVPLCPQTVGPTMSPPVDELNWTLVMPPDPAKRNLTRGAGAPDQRASTIWTVIGEPVAFDQE